MLKPLMKRTLIVNVAGAFPQEAVRTLTVVVAGSGSVCAIGRSVTTVWNELDGTVTDGED